MLLYSYDTRIPDDSYIRRLRFILLSLLERLYSLLKPTISKITESLLCILTLFIRMSNQPDPQGGTSHPRISTEDKMIVTGID